MFEQDQALLTLQLQKLPPATVPSEPIWQQARRLADHRLIYLDYEGVVSGDRGEVRAVARGHFTCPYESSTGNSVRYTLASERLNAAVVIPPCQIHDAVVLRIESWRLTGT